MASGGSTSTDTGASSSPTGSSGGGANGYLSGVQHGDGTFYDAGLGACGQTNAPGDMIAAISEQAFDGYPGATANPNNNPICGKQVKATCKSHVLYDILHELHF